MEKRNAYLKEIEDIPKELFVFIDESGVDKTCWKQRGWSRIGEKIIGKVIGKSIQRTNILAGLCGQEIVAPLLFQGACDTEFFMGWVEQSLVKSLKKGQVVVMDNASFHKSPRVRRAIEEAGCRLIYLPPYSPDFNPIEHFWANMKKWIKHNIPNMTNTWEALTTFFNAQTSF